MLTLDLDFHPHLTHLVSYSRTAYLHAFGGVSSSFSVIPFVPQQLGGCDFVSAGINDILEANVFKCMCISLCFYKINILKAT